MAFHAHNKDDYFLLTAVTTFAEQASKNETKIGTMVNKLLELKAAMEAIMISPPLPRCCTSMPR